MVGRESRRPRPRGWGFHEERLTEEVAGVFVPQRLAGTDAIERVEVDRDLLTAEQREVPRAEAVPELHLRNGATARG